MSAAFQKIDKIRPAHDITYRVTLFLCKLSPVVDILITTMAMAGRYISFIPDPVWSEEVVLTCMFYMAVLSAVLTIGRSAHICMTAFGQYLPVKVVGSPDIIAGLAVFALAVITIIVGWKYAIGIGSKGTYVSIPKVSKFWMYFPAPLAGVAMLALEVKALYNYVKSFFVKEGME